MGTRSKQIRSFNYQKSCDMDEYRSIAEILDRLERQVTARTAAGYAKMIDEINQSFKEIINIAISNVGKIEETIKRDIKEMKDSAITISSTNAVIEIEPSTNLLVDVDQSFAKQQWKKLYGEAVNLALSTGTRCRKNDILDSFRDDDSHIRDKDQELPSMIENINKLINFKSNFYSQNQG